MQKNIILIVNPAFLRSFKALYNYIGCVKSWTTKLENNLGLQRLEVKMKTEVEVAEQRKREAFNKDKILLKFLVKHATVPARKFAFHKENCSKLFQISLMDC